ncbi:MAG: ORF6C domain-containing protein [Clostridium sp.]
MESSNAAWQESRQAQLINNGIINIEGMLFHSIEGGFGEGKKAMLVKEIAGLHGMDLKVVNQSINRNRKRFNDGMDIVDLKSVTMSDRDFLKEIGFSNSSIANANNIYLLSERGYSKLLKILDDDFAWEQYDKLVDGYFNSRAENKRVKELSSREQLKLYLQSLEEQDKKIEYVERKVEDLEVNMPLFNIECDELQKLVKKRCTYILGGYKSAAYKDKSLRSKVYSDMQNQIKREFGLSSYKAIKRSQYGLAKEIIEGYKVPIVLEEEIRVINSQISI